MRHPVPSSAARLNQTASALPPGNPPEPPESTDLIAANLAERGWCVSDDFIPPLLTEQLRHEALAAWQEGGFRPAGVGRGAGLEVRPEVRTDFVAWLDPANLGGAQRLYWERLEALRLALNRALFLGLLDFEGHLAVYPPGTYYRRHLDQFHGIGARQLSCILYLNRDWTAEDGGQLRIFIDPQDPEAHVEVLPEGGRLVCFLSARFLHEVLPSRRERLSLTGWFKGRG